MLHEFLTANRDEIIARSRAKVAERAAPRPTEAELKNGVPLFLNQLIEALRVSGASNEEEIGKGATQHGHDLLRMGFTVAQVIHDYGDVCQVVTELAVNRKAPITTEEFHTFNRCLDDAMAQAVTAHARHREQSIADEGTERAGVLAHELRNLVFAAMMAFDILKRGSVGIGGSTGAVLGRSLRGLRDLIDRALTEVRLEAGIQKRERMRPPRSLPLRRFFSSPFASPGPNIRMDSASPRHAITAS
jgi:signal transduction histidine kinase